MKRLPPLKRLPRLKGLPKLRKLKVPSPVMKLAAPKRKRVPRPKGTTPSIRKPQVRTRGIKRLTVGISYGDYLARDSEFGGTMLERSFDGAAHLTGHRFNAAQVYHEIALTGSYTLIDRLVLHPLQAVYADGIQHRMRLDHAAKDLLQTIQLESDGYRVMRISDVDFYMDPLRVIQTRIDWYGAGESPQGVPIIRITVPVWTPAPPPYDFSQDWVDEWSDIWGWHVSGGD